MPSNYNFPIGLSANNNYSSLGNFGASLGNQPVNTDGLFSSGSMFGTKDTSGWLSGGLGAAGSIFNAWQGMQQLGLAEDALNSQKAYSAANLANQAQTTNTALEDRQRARLAVQGLGSEAVNQGVNDYMSLNRVQGTV